MVLKRDTPVKAVNLTLKWLMSSAGGGGGRRGEREREKRRDEREYLNGPINLSLRQNSILGLSSTLES